MDLITEAIARKIVEAQIRKQVEGIKPVQYSQSDLARAISPGNTVFFGILNYNPTQLFGKVSLTGRNAYYTKLFGTINYHFHSQNLAAPAIILFDQLCSNTNTLSTISNYELPVIATTETTIAQDLAAGFILPLIIFSGYEIRIN